MDELLRPLPDAWGKYDDWQADASGNVFLRTADFKTAQDARMFNRWAENDYRIRGMRTDARTE